MPSLSSGWLDSRTSQLSLALGLTSGVASFPEGAKITIIFFYIDLYIKMNGRLLKSVTLFVTVRGATRQLRVQIFVLCFKENAEEFRKPSWSPSHDPPQQFSGSRLGSVVSSRSLDLKEEVSRSHSG